MFSPLPPDYRLAPYTDSSASPDVSVFARAQSTYYLDWTPAGGHDPIALRLEDLGGNAPPGHMFFWILRVQ